tara:strand:+ start:222 stop:497 length:276 start_codon:yes stop_codon:yes gene_type:complete
LEKRGAKTPENQNSQVGTNLGKVRELFFQGFHPLVEHLDEPFQEPCPTALAGTDIDKGVVVIAQIDIVKVFEMGGHFLDVHCTAVDRFTGM